MSESPDLESLTTDWLALPDLAEAIGVSLDTVRQWVREGQLTVIAHGERRIPSVPADFVHNATLVRGLASTLTVLADVGFGAEEAVAWLLQYDDVLDARPVDFMAEGRDVAVRRRALMLAI